VAKEKEVYFVHSVDTEGPLFESPKATLSRIEDLLNVKIKNKNSSTLKKILNGKYFSNSNQLKFEKIITLHLLSYNDTWKKIEEMLKRISKNKFRSTLKDSNGASYKISWHCVDHVNYLNNPRRRDIGYSKIFNFYNNFIKKYHLNDKIHFHFHPMPISKEANRNATLYFRSDNLYQILCRRILDKNWFPVANRAGFHVERPDSHWFLEQFIPFDLSNTNKKERNSGDPSMDSRLWDWRRAPNSWEIYRPSHDDYQKKGNCRRYIGRVLSILNRTESIDSHEVEKAFKRASLGKKTLLAVTSHDFRNMETEILHVKQLLKNCLIKYPKVKIYYCDVVTAFQKVIGYNSNEIKRNAIKLKIVRIKKNAIKVKTLSGEVFGPQPFLAIRTKKKLYFHDNLDFGLKKNEWYYTFCDDTVNIQDLDLIGVGAADKYGNYSVSKMSF
jgi:hypothetical protein